MRSFLIAGVAALAFAVTLVGSAPAQAARCGNGAGGFEAWKQDFAEEARGSVGSAGVDALMSTHYNSATICADRGQKSFHLSLEAFMAKRGASAIVARGRQLKRSMAGLFQSVDSRYGVSPGVLLAIWGMETGFGAAHGQPRIRSPPF